MDFTTTQLEGDNAEDVPGIYGKIGLSGRPLDEGFTNDSRI